MSKDSNLEESNNISMSLHFKDLKDIKDTKENRDLLTYKKTTKQNMLHKKLLNNHLLPSVYSLNNSTEFAQTETKFKSYFPYSISTKFNNNNNNKDVKNETTSTEFFTSKKKEAKSLAIKFDIKANNSSQWKAKSDS